MLTDVAIKCLKPRKKQFKNLTVGGFISLSCRTAASTGRFDYTFLDKRKMLAVGVYPDVSLEMARERHQEARRLLADGISCSL